MGSDGNEPEVGMERRFGRRWRVKREREREQVYLYKAARRELGRDTGSGREPKLEAAKTCKYISLLSNSIFLIF